MLMKTLFLSLLFTVFISTCLFADDDQTGIPPNAQKVGPVTMREPGKTCYNYLIRGKRFTEDLLVAKEVYDGSQLVERDLYKSELDRNGLPQANLNGIQRKWHTNGQLASEGPYENGVMNGTFKQWNSRGQLIAQYEMVRGTGEKMIYNDVGELILDEQYVKNMPDGTEMSVSTDGKIISLFSNGDSALYKIGCSFYRDGKICEIMWNGGPLIEYNEAGVAFDKIWQINGQRMSEKEYAQKAGGSPNLPHYFSDPNQYKQLVPQSILDALNKYRAMPRVKIPLEFDKDGKPVPAS